MIRTFIQTKSFSADWDRLSLKDGDLRRLEANILSDPNHYPVIQGTGGLRKARFAFGHQGMRGSVRVCYIDFPRYRTVYLIAVYPKNEKENLTMAEKTEIKKLISVLEEALQEAYHE